MRCVCMALRAFEIANSKYIQLKVCPEILMPASPILVLSILVSLGTLHGIKTWVSANEAGNKAWAGRNGWLGATRGYSGRPSWAVCHQRVTRPRGSNFLQFRFVSPARAIVGPPVTQRLTRHKHTTLTTATLTTSDRAALVSRPLCLSLGDGGVVLGGPLGHCAALQG